MKFIKFLLILFISINSPIKAESNQSLINELKNGGKLIFIRHAYAPGGGDPNNFDINDTIKFIIQNMGLFSGIGAGLDKAF